MLRTRLPRTLIAPTLCFILLFMVLLKQPVHAQSLTVINLNDSGVGSLREAISTAAAGATITFADGLTGTITLNSMLTINKDLTIDGPDADVITISGNNAVMVMYVGTDMTTDFSLRDITIANGLVSSIPGDPCYQNAAGICNAGTTNLNNVILQDNRGAAAVVNNGFLFIWDSLITGNQAKFAPAIGNGGSLAVVRSTISNNIASPTAPGFYGTGEAAGIYSSGLAMIINSTITGNSAVRGGGIYQWGLNVWDETTVINSTIANNTASDAGSNIYIDARIVTVKNSIIANGNGSANCNTALTDGGNNLQYPDSSCGGTITTSNPLLGPLANNGGFTKTLALLFGSPAIDAGNPTVCADTSTFGVNNVDQRGVTRPIDGDANGSTICDIGAVEVPGLPPTNTSTHTPTMAICNPPTTTKRVTVNSAGNEALTINPNTQPVASSAPSLSNDGRYVVHQSGAYNLVDNDTNNMVDIFVYDTHTCTTQRVSVASNGNESNGANSIWGLKQVISGDGRYVAFTSSATNLVSGDTNSGGILVHDRQTGQTTRVSVSSSGIPANSAAQPIISDNGRYVLFTSRDTTLDGNADGGFIHDRQTGQTTHLPYTSYDQVIALGDVSTDVRYVTFRSSANNLIPNDTNNQPDIFVYDRQTEEISRVSVSSTGQQANNYSSGGPSISGDGRYVTFSSAASNLVDNDTNNAVDVFVHDRQTGETRRVSVSSTGEQGNAASGDSSISADGNIIAFDSNAGNLVSGDTNNGMDIFAHNQLTGQTIRVSVTTNGEQANDGVYLGNLSGDGHYIGFISPATNLVDNDTNNTWDTFIAPVVFPIVGPTSTPTDTPTNTLTHTPTSTYTPSNTPLPTLTFTPSSTPSLTPTATPSNTPTATPISLLPTNTRVLKSRTQVPLVNGLRGFYFNNADLTSLVLNRVDPTVNFNWLTGSPAVGVDPDTFSVRWTGSIVPQYSQPYRFHVEADGGVRLWINGVMVINNWVDANTTRTSTAVTLTGGTRYPIQLDYFENTGNAKVILYWSSTSQPKQVIPTTRLFSRP